MIRRATWSGTTVPRFEGFSTTSRAGEEASRTIDKLRAQTAEGVNALCRNRGFQHMPVRGLENCRIVATLFAMTHDLIQQGNVRAAVAEGAN